ncbi:MAG TPA: Asp-tRNA(Asn)/Glu-tRNA(Gln) amidotransferase subunit GatA [Candidatus Dormibacteraeota bacterium]|nr:Asp-tRNA(Asn)/Glu-tRNA(Gln) amidotransferase subunit GatA [Candidatus Dormibacteraeota bacterium]
MTAAQMGAALRRGELTPRQLLDDARAQVGRLDGSLHAFLARTDELADAQAERAAGMLREDPDGAGPLCGIPVALKDVLCVEGYPTTAGSRILETFRPPYTATAVQRLLDAGAVPMGKTNCDEFAMGSSTENSAFGPVGNPWDLERVPGGSSGGSAAAVGAGMVPISYGTDTGGSIRQPASLSGVVGFKPTYGRVSRYGLIAFASSLDQIGPFAHTVEDAAAAYGAVGGNDPRDSTSVRDAMDDPLATLHDGVRGMRLGLPREYMGEGLEPGVRDRVTEAVRVLEELGASVTEVSLPSTDLGLSTYYVLAPAECSSNLARYDGVRFGRRVERPSLTETYLRTRGEGFGNEVKRRVMLGTYALSSGYYDAYYRRAQRVRTLIAREFDAVFTQVDALVCPTSPKVAFTTGAIQDPVEMYLNDALTIPVNLAGLPGISLPCGFSERLPVGLQVIAPRLCDARVFQVAAAYEAATEWHRQRAPLVSA